MKPDRYSRPARVHGRNRVGSLLNPSPMTYLEKLDLAADWLDFAMLLNASGQTSPLLKLIHRRADEIVSQCDWQS